MGRKLWVHYRDFEKTHYYLDHDIIYITYNPARKRDNFLTTEPYFSKNFQLQISRSLPVIEKNLVGILCIWKKNCPRSPFPVNFPFVYILYSSSHVDLSNVFLSLFLKFSVLVLTLIKKSSELSALPGNLFVMFVYRVVTNSAK